MGVDPYDLYVQTQETQREHDRGFRAAEHTRTLKQAAAQFGVNLDRLKKQTAYTNLREAAAQQAALTKYRQWLGSQATMMNEQGEMEPNFQGNYGGLANDFKESVVESQPYADWIAGQVRELTGGGSGTEMVKVRNKATGETGSMPKKNFDADKYELVQ
jgi:hypothetical protein